MLRFPAFVRATEVNSRNNRRTEHPAPRRQWRPFDDARAWAQAQRLKFGTQWRERTKQRGWLPADIPKCPDNAYEASWISWGDFLGTGYIASQNRRYRSFTAARTWVHTKAIKSQTQWNMLVKQIGWRPEDIPSNPSVVYKKEWASWGDFFGTGAIATFNRKYRPFDEAREWARQQYLSSREAWLALYRQNLFPDDIPASPRVVYASEWTGWRDFLRS